MSVTKKILSNTFWQVLGKVLTAGLGIVSIKMITNYLSTNDYGIYTTLFEYISFFAIAANFGLFTIGVKEMAQKKHPVDFILGNLLSLRIILITITLFSGGVITMFIPSYQGTNIPSAIWLVILITSIALINGTLNSVLQYNMKMLAANISLVIGKIISLGYIAATIYFFFPSQTTVGFTHLLYGGLIGNIVMLILTAISVKQDNQIRLRFNKKYLVGLITRAAPYGFALVLSTIYFRIDIILIGLLQDLTQVGIYGVPLKLMEILSVLPVFFMNSLLPTLTEYVEKNVKKAYQTVNNAFELIYMLALPILIGGFILAYPITASISSPQFLTGYHCNNNEQIVFTSRQTAADKCPNVPIESNFQVDTTTDNIDNSDTFFYRKGSDQAFKLIIFAIFFSFLNTLFTFTLIAFNKQSKLLIINSIGVVFNLITNLIFIQKYGFLGAATTTIISEIAILIGTMYYYNQVGKISPNLKNLGKITAAAAVMGMLIYELYEPTASILASYNILVLTPLGALVYAAILKLTNTISVEKLKTLLN